LSLNKKKISNKRLRKKYKQKQELKLLQVELRKLFDWLKPANKRLVILVEGRDTAGKGRFIKAFLKHLNPKHAKTVALNKPTTVEQGQIYQQRHMSHMPAIGDITIFDRSYYNRAMVERVLGFCTEEESKKFLKNTPLFENFITSDGNTIFIKLYFSITKFTQQERLAKREVNPLTSWKFSQADSQALDKYDDYTGAKFKMLKHTCTDAHPWTIIRADKRSTSRITALKYVVDSINYEGKSKDIDLFIPEGDVLTGMEELAFMKQAKRDHGRFTEQASIVEETTV
jgi:polyphosphate kinase 2